MSESIDERVAQLHEELAATAELPIDREASRWIGEAEAITGDLVASPADRDVVYERVSHVVELLDHVEETGTDAADDHVDAAKRLAAETIEAIDVGVDE